MKALHVSEFIGASLTIVGSFLPWERGGGFGGIVTSGIRVDITNFKYWITGIHEFPVYDYGGAFVVLLTLVFILFVLQPPRFIQNPILWNLIISSILMTSSLLFVGRWWLHRYEFGNSIEQPSLMIGLVCVLLGSALLLWMSIMNYRRIPDR